MTSGHSGREKVSLSSMHLSSYVSPAPFSVEQIAKTLKHAIGLRGKRVDVNQVVIVRQQALRSLIRLAEIDSTTTTEADRRRVIHDHNENASVGRIRRRSTSIIDVQCRPAVKITEVATQPDFSSSSFRA